MWISCFKWFYFDNLHLRHWRLTFLILFVSSRKGVSSSVETAFSLKSKWSCCRQRARNIKQVGLWKRTPKGWRLLGCRERAHSRAPATPPLDTHISLRFNYYVQPLKPVPSWRRVFQFLISFSQTLGLKWHLGKLRLAPVQGLFKFHSYFRNDLRVKLSYFSQNYGVLTVFMC